MNHKKFNLIIILALFGLFLLNITINIIFDPFYIFKTPIINGYNNIKPDLKKQERLTKIIEYKLNKNSIETIFLGSSRVDYGIDSSYYTTITGKKSMNLGMKATGIRETVDIIKLAVNNNQKLKNIYLGVDFFGFGTPQDKKSQEEPRYYSSLINFNEITTVLLSQDALTSSMNTFVYSLKNNRDIEFDYDGLRTLKKDSNAYDQAISEMDIYMNKEVFYKNFKLSDTRFEDLKEIMKICVDNNINLIVFVNPINIVQLQAIAATNNYEGYKQWKIKLADVTSYYDFSGFNSITTEPLTAKMQFYFDSNHYQRAVGNKIIDVLTNNSKYSDFGVLINKDNIENHINKNDSAFSKWKKQNQELVKQINSLKKW